nr:MAG TPA: hypothetical protein [Caudoviricetes sp.]
MEITPPIVPPSLRGCCPGCVPVMLCHDVMI